MPLRQKAASRWLNKKSWRLAQFKHTHQAEFDLVEIWLYVAVENLDAADRLLESIEQKCRLLAEHKLLGREHPDLDAQLRSFPVGNYIVYFKLESDAIIVVRVLHGSRDHTAMFGNQI